MKRTRGIGDLNTNSGSNTKRVDELVDVLKLNSDYTLVRLIGDVWGYAQHWIEIETRNGVISIPKVVPNYDPVTDTFDQTIDDPYKEISNPIRTQRAYYINAIVRDIQDDEPRKKPKHTRQERRTGYKEKDSRSWTPVKVLRIPVSVAATLQKIITMNKHKVKGKVKGCELTDPEYGCDIFIAFDGKISGPNKYSVQKGDHTPLSEEECEYLKWDLSNLMTAESPEEALREAQSLETKSPHDEDEDHEDEDDDELDRRSKKRSSDKEDDDDRAARRRRRRKERESRTERTTRSKVRSEEVSADERRSRRKKRKRSTIAD